MKELEEYKKYCRKFPVELLLDYFSKKSIESYRKDGRGYTITDVPYYNKYGLQIGIHKNYMYGQWDFIEVCYLSIKYANDYRNNTVDENAFFNLINKVKSVNEILESESGLQENNIFKHLICITNVQFEFQSYNIINHFNRIYHMMVKINCDPQYEQTKEVCYVNFMEKFKEITGFNYLKFVKAYLLATLLIVASNKSDIYEVMDSVDIDGLELGITKKEILDVIEFQSRDYSFYRSTDNWNVLRYYPIVKTQKHKRLIVANIYALINSFSGTTYWILRNYYNEQCSNKFLTYFGYCFECYVNELFETYNINYKKIPKKHYETPDWIIETGQYIILVEQKSALFPIDARITTKENRYKSLDKFLNHNIKKAFKQLDSYDVNSKKTMLRMCLLLETVYFPEMVEEIIFKDFYFSKENDKNLNWIVNINEFEKLMYLIYDDENKFNSYISEKIKLNKEKSNNGRGFDSILRTEENDYIRNHINHFQELTNELKRKIISNAD